MLEKVLKLCLCLVITALALGVVAAMASLLLYGFVMAVIAALVGAVAAPNEVKAVWQAFAGRIDGWIGRLEKLWRDVREGIDLWGAAQMQRQAAEAPSEAPAEPRSGDGPGAPSVLEDTKPKN